MLAPCHDHGLLIVSSNNQFHIYSKLCTRHISTHNKGHSLYLKNACSFIVAHYDRRHTLSNTNFLYKRMSLHRRQHTLHIICYISFVDLIQLSPYCATFRTWSLGRLFAAHIGYLSRLCLLLLQTSSNLLQNLRLCMHELCLHLTLQSMPGIHWRPSYLILINNHVRYDMKQAN